MQNVVMILSDEGLKVFLETLQKQPDQSLNVAELVKAVSQASAEKPVAPTEEEIESKEYDGPIPEVELPKVKLPTVDEYYAERHAQMGMDLSEVETEEEDPEEEEAVQELVESYQQAKSEYDAEELARKEDERKRALEEGRQKHFEQIREEFEPELQAVTEILENSTRPLKLRDIVMRLKLKYGFEWKSPQSTYNMTKVMKYNPNVVRGEGFGTYTIDRDNN
jgi:hypothetical protein